MSEEATKCKICGVEHRVDHYRGMTFYVCPETMRVYLVTKENEDGVHGREHKDDTE